MNTQLIDLNYLVKLYDLGFRRVYKIQIQEFNTSPKQIYVDGGKNAKPDYLSVNSSRKKTVKLPCIYGIKNIYSQEVVYVGQSRNHPSLRFHGHFGDFKGAKFPANQRNNHVLIILQEGVNKQHLDDRENHWIKRFQTTVINKVKPKSPTQVIIYMIIDKWSRKKYIGKTGELDVEKRIWGHLHRHKTSPFYGMQRSDIDVRILEKITGTALSRVSEAEQFWIETMGTMKPKGLNSLRAIKQEKEVNKLPYIVKRGLKTQIASMVRSGLPKRVIYFQLAISRHNFYYYCKKDPGFPLNVKIYRYLSENEIDDILKEYIHSLPLKNTKAKFNSEFKRLKKIIKRNRAKI